MEFILFCFRLLIFRVGMTIIEVSFFNRFTYDVTNGVDDGCAEGDKIVVV